MSEPDAQALLDELADRYGIAPDYYDNWGRRHVTTADTKRAMLRAMGVPAETSEQVRQGLAGWEQALWQRVCEPVIVRRVPGNPGRWSLRLPCQEAEEPDLHVVWDVHDEAGRVRHKGAAGPGLRAAETAVLQGRRYARFELPLPAGLEIGYYKLTVRTPSGKVKGSATLILCPPACFLPPQLKDEGRTWGVALQLYALRSARNWGVGDFADLADVTEWAAKGLGAGVIGLNPLHALKNVRPYHVSPYSPDSRLFLNPLYVAVDRIPELQHGEEGRRLREDVAFRSRLDMLRKTERVEYEQVQAAKLEVLQALFAAFCARHDVQGSPTTDRGRAFDTYLRAEGEPLEQFALFQVLREEMQKAHPDVWSWQQWPEPYRDHRSPAVASFREQHRTRVQFHQYLQWIASEQLTQVAAQTRQLGMPIGLYHDLALGSDRSGSEAWVFQDVLALEADCGAPPDAFSPEGQNWGLSPVNPHRLRADGYRMFTALLRRNLAHGGALRLDHVMGLFRLFWIPRGLPASAGAYVRYPHDDLLGIAALESVRHQAVIVGEDLGTVPDWVRERLSAACVLSYRVCYFEREVDGSWRAPAAYPECAMAVVTTHDLPTLSGFWSGEDLDTRARLGFYPDEAALEAVRLERQRDKTRILEELNVQGLLPEGLPTDAAAAPEMAPALCRAIHAFLARTPSRIMMASIEDAIGERCQTNLPGTVERHPNWSRKLALTLEELQDDPRPWELAATIRSLRQPKDTA